MSSKSVNFFPEDEPPGNSTAGANIPGTYPQTPGSHADLAALRKSWSARFQDMPALPGSSPHTGGQARETMAEPIPELPSLGAMASRAVLSAEGHDELFNQGDHSSPARGKATEPQPLPVGEIPLSDDLEPFSFTTATGSLASGYPQRKRPALDIPQIPEANSPFTTTVTSTERATERANKLLHEIPALDSPPSSGEDFAATTGDRPLPFISDEPSAGQDTAAETFADSPAESSAWPPEAGAREVSPFSRFKADETTPDKEPAFTDQDLQDALRPLIEPSVDKFLYTPTHSIHSYLEPMLRSTVRRAIAEQMEDASPFRDVSGWDKFTWKLRALMSSRSYEEILFDHTRRYRVEEVFLLRPKTRSLISYASHDPARHAKPGKVEGTVKKIATKIAHKADKDGSPIKWEDKRQLLIRNGKHSTLVAIVHGTPNAILRSDLDYAIRQAEDRFGKTLEDDSDIHLQILQPLLEGCLLIQSVATPN